MLLQSIITCLFYIKCYWVNKLLKLLVFDKNLIHTGRMKDLPLIITILSFISVLLVIITCPQKLKKKSPVIGAGILLYINNLKNEKDEMLAKEKTTIGQS